MLSRLALRSTIRSGTILQSSRLFSVSTGRSQEQQPQKSTNNEPAAKPKKRPLSRVAIGGSSDHNKKVLECQSSLLHGKLSSFC